jgi:glycosyltransferase involved in cell wall biosynthesis
MSNAIRPLHVGKFVPPPYAGIEGHVDLLLRSFPATIDATLVAGESAHGQDIKPPPYRVLTAKSYGKFASATLSPGVLGHVRNEISSNRSNLLHIHAPNPWGDLAALLGAGKVPVVMTWHSDIVRQKKLMLAYQYLQRAVLRRVDRILVYTPKHYDSSAQLHQLPLADKIVNIPIGIDFDKVSSAHASADALVTLNSFVQGRPMILTVGRHVAYKGYKHLLDAMARLRSDAVLVMIGAGVLSEILAQQVQDLGLADRVLMMGEVDNASLVTALHRCDVFCLPSVQPSEAFGIASAEAMACGKPTVVCELNNGVNYLNQKDLTSLTVPPQDAAALADALDQLVLNDSLRSTMGEAARSWVHSQFSVRAMVDETVRLYQQLLGAH